MQVAAGMHLATGCIWAGDHAGAETVLRGLLALLRGQPRRERFGLQEFPAIGCRWYLAWSLAERGEFPEATALGWECLRVAEEIGFQHSLTLAHWGVAHAHIVKGDLAEAERLLGRARALCREWELLVLVPNIDAALGYVYALSGRVAEGRALLEDALRSYWSMGAGWIIPPTAVRLGEVYLREGRLDDARAFAEEGWRLACERGHRGIEAQALHVRGEIASRCDPVTVDPACTLHRQALTLADELGMRPLAARCHLALGRLHGQAGDRALAARHLGDAARLFAEMGMPPLRDELG